MGTRYLSRYYKSWVFTHAGKKISFPDRLHGGKAKALAFAIKYRDDYFAHYGLPPVNENKRYLKKKTPFLRPIVGVGRSCVLVKNRGYYLYWRASWYDGKKLIAKNFSAAYYGEELAFELACEARYEASGILIVKNFDQMPCKPSVPFKDYYKI